MLRILLTLLILLLPLRASAIAFQLMVAKSETRSQLVGEWEVDSTVTWSDCDYVEVGSKAVSKIKINDINGKLYPEWKAHDWQLVRNKAIDFHYDDSLHWERESKLEDGEDYWFVRSITEIKFNAEGQLVGKDHVKQYLNGEFVGSYISEAVLSKLVYSASSK